jgi:hypothetical protein
MKLKNLLILALLATGTIVSAQAQRKTPYEFVPETCLYKEFWGDLNKDDIDDCVLIIQSTDSTGFVTDERTGIAINRNRRGVIITFKKGENYELMLQNTDFLESDNEDGGVYFAPELSVEIKRGNLIFSYEHGRYGSWKYTFRYKNNDFQLIGYDSFVGSGQYTKTEYSINFLTKKMKTTIYDEREDEPDPKYPPKIQWKDIEVDKFCKLSEGTIDDVFNYVFDDYIWFYRENK